MSESRDIVCNNKGKIIAELYHFLSHKKRDFSMMYDMTGDFSTSLRSAQNDAIKSSFPQCSQGTHRGATSFPIHAVLTVIENLDCASSQAQEYIPTRIELSQLRLDDDCIRKKNISQTVPLA